MKAAVGDRIVVASTIVDQPLRDGRVVEVRHPDGSPPYLVEWGDTGERTLVFPGPDAHIQHGTGAAPAGPGRVVKTWTVTITITEEGDETTATAVLSEHLAPPVDAVGHAHRNPHDPKAPAIGDEVAVARALRRLADRVQDVADADIGASIARSGHPTA